MPRIRTSPHLAAPSRPAAKDHSVLGGERFDVGGILGPAGKLHATVADVQFIPDDVEVRLVALKHLNARSIVFLRRNLYGWTTKFSIARPGQLKLEK